MGFLKDMFSGLFNFGLGQASSAIDWKREQKKMQLQQGYELEQMAKEQEYNFATMEQQNQYQIAAEERANEYNSVGAQVERARQAGVSPLAALGSGGAGGTMSVSSAPSGGAPSGGSGPSGGAPRSSTPNLFDLSATSRADAIAAAEIEKTEEETKLVREQIVKQEIENEISENTKQYDILVKKYGSKIAGFQASILEFQDSVKQLQFETDQKERNARIQELSAKVISIQAHDEIDREVADATMRRMSKEIMLMGSQIDLNTASVREVESRTLLNGANYLLSLSQSDYYDVMTVNGWDQHDANLIRNSLEKERAAFENLHREEIHNQSMKNQRRDNTAKILNGVGSLFNGLSSMAYSACAIAGTVVTGGYGGNFAAAGGQIPKGSPLRGGQPTGKIGYKID